MPAMLTLASPGSAVPRPTIGPWYYLAAANPSLEAAQPAAFGPVWSAIYRRLCRNLRRPSLVSNRVANQRAPRMEIIATVRRSTSLLNVLWSLLFFKHAPAGLGADPKSMPHIGFRSSALAGRRLWPGHAASASLLH